MHELPVAFCMQATSYFLLHELRVFFLHTSYELLFITRVMSYFLTMSYNKDKDDKSVYDNTVMLKNYFLGSFFDKKNGVH